MNKLKFLFVTLLFGLVFVFNFSKADTYSCSCVNGGWCYVLLDDYYDFFVGYSGSVCTGTYNYPSFSFERGNLSANPGSTSFSPGGCSWSGNYVTSGSFDKITVNECGRLSTIYLEVSKNNNNGGSSSGGGISGDGSSNSSLDSSSISLDWFYGVGYSVVEFFTGVLNVLSYVWSIFQAMWYGLTTLLSGTYDLTYDVFNYGLF